MTAIPLPVVAQRPLWRAAQWTGLLLTVVLLAALVIVPAPALHLLWDMVIPLLPAVFLVNPVIWRNVCPLATLNELTSARRADGSIEGATLRHAWAFGIALLFLMVPARRFLFNEGGVVLAATVTAVALLALIGGAVFARRAGFCGTICPVLPVEKLYGQSPIVTIGSARCADCTRCTSAGCIDLAGAKAVAQTLGPQRREVTWLRTSFGAFAAAFPGFILAYFTTPNGALDAAASVYLRVFGASVASYVLVAFVTVVFNVRAAVAMPVLGATALAAYYWHASRTLMEAYHAPLSALPVLRVAIAAALVWWMVRALRPAGAWARPAV